MPGQGQKLWGVVYEITILDIGKLDKSEGYLPGRKKNSYFRRECVVFLYGDDKQPLNVFMFDSLVDQALRSHDGVSTDRLHGDLDPVAIVTEVARIFIST